MRTPNLIPIDTLRKTTKSIVNRNPKESNNPRYHRRPNKWKPLNIIESKEEWTLIHRKSSKKNGKESQGKKKAEEGLMGPKKNQKN
jgi:hypothetical protein